MEQKELHEVHDMINDVWQFIKTHAAVTDKDEYWDELLTSADDIWFKHDKHPLCRGLLTECVKHLEREVHQDG